MSGAEIAYLAARILSCGIWVAAGLHKAAHYEKNIAEMTHLGVPLPRLVLPLVLVLEMAGAAMLILDWYLWLAALAWLTFLVPASWMYHFRFMVKDGTIDFPQFVTGWKNVSIAGGLIALILLDSSRPAWLFPGS
jgi:putative oxidoreductase